MIKELKARHRNIIQMSFNGFKNSEIAERFEMSIATVSNIICSPLGKAYMEGLTDKIKDTTLDVRKELVSMNKDALSTFKDLLAMKNKTPASVRFNTAKDILDRTGFKAPDKLNIDMVFQTKSDDEIDAEITALENSINGTNIIAPSKDDSEPTPKTQTIPSTTYSELDNLPNDESSSNKEILEDPEFDPFNNIEEPNE